MHGGSGLRVGDSSDEDGDDDDDDEFEDSEQTEATAAGTDAEESMTSEGELCATPESGPRSMDDKWVTVKGQVLAPSPQLLLSTPVDPGPEAVHEIAIVSATAAAATAAHHRP
jgi:hypothetical protein